MNGRETRVRGRDFEDEEDHDSPGKRPSTINHINNISTDHYDIYAIPSLSTPLPHLPPLSTPFQSASLLVVHRVSALSGSGILYTLLPSPDQSSLFPSRDPGFFLPREESYDPSKAVLLGWVEEERLNFFDQLVAGILPPQIGEGREGGTRGGGESMVWLKLVLARLEYEGILSNPELLCEGLLEGR